MYRAALRIDDDTWRRAAGIAMHQAVMITPYYRRGDPDFVTSARRTIVRNLADVSI